MPWNSMASSSVSAKQTQWPTREPWEGMQGTACPMMLRGLLPLQKQQHSGISSSANVRLLTCTICSCKSQSISTFLSCRNAFLNTVIYPQKSREQAPPSQNHVLLLSTATLPYPTERPTQRKAQNPPPKPETDGHSTYATDKNFYFFLMTLNTTATRGKT